MRKVIYAINLTIDGCCDHTKGIGYEDIHDHFTNLMRDVDLLAYGRKTYELMVPYWPDVAKNHSASSKVTNDFAQMFASIDRIVFSRTLQSVEDKKTRIVSASLQDEILRLKQEEGKNILLGGVDVPTQLIELGLVDELHIIVQPIVAGEGRRLLDSTSLPEKLLVNLIETKALPSGCVVLRYIINGEEK